MADSLGDGAWLEEAAPKDVLRKGSSPLQVPPVTFSTSQPLQQTSPF